MTPFAQYVSIICKHLKRERFHIKALMSLPWQPWAGLDSGRLSLWGRCSPGPQLSPLPSLTPGLLHSLTLPPWPLETLEVESPEVNGIMGGSSTRLAGCFGVKCVTSGAMNITAESLLLYATVIPCLTVRMCQGLLATYFETYQKTKWTDGWREGWTGM